MEYDMPTFYIEVNRSDPNNDCRGVWSDDMIREAISQAKNVFKLVDQLRYANSTKDKFDLMKEFTEIDMHCLPVLINTIEEELAERINENIEQNYYHDDVGTPA